MAIENGYMEESNNFYNNYQNDDYVERSNSYVKESNNFYNNYQNDGYFEERFNDIDKLIVKVKIYLQNLERTGFFKN